MKWIEVDWDGRKIPAADWSHLDHDEWLGFRNSYHKIGGSEVGTVCGFDAFKDPIILFHEKIGLKKKNMDGNVFTAGGHLDEEAIMTRLEHYDGSEWVQNYYSKRKFRRIERPKYTLFPEHMPWAAFNLDGRCYDDEKYPDKGSGVGEAKKIGGRYSDMFVGGVPPNYLFQVVGYMMGTGAKYSHTALLKDGVDLIVRTYDIDMDEYQAIAKIVDMKCSIFYKAMMAGIEVMATKGLSFNDKMAAIWDIEEMYSDILYVSASEELSAWYSELHKMREERVRTQGDEQLRQLCEEKFEVDGLIKNLTEKKDLTDNRIKQWMIKAGADVATGEGYRVSFTSNLRVTPQKI